MRLSTFKAFVVFIATVPGTSLAANAEPSPPTAEMRQKIEALVDQARGAGEATPAYTVLVDISGETVFQYSSGFANIELAVKAGPDTVYQIGSITKSYTALAIALLAEQGAVNLDSPVEQYLTDYEGPGAKVTVRQLLVHTSGIPNYTGLPEAQPLMTWVQTERSDIVGLFKDKELDFTPGSNYSYSNSGYYLLGLIIEKISKQNYYDYLQQHVFEPLGLRDTVSGRYEEIVSGRAQGYIATPDAVMNAAPTPYLTPFAAGSLQATAADLARYRRGVFTNPTFSRILNTLLETGSFDNGVAHRYAQGALDLSEHHGYEVWGHSGGISGFLSHHNYYPALEMTVVALTNNGATSVSPGKISNQVTSIILGKEPATTQDPAPRTVSNGDLTPLIGSYLMSPFRITGDGHISVLLIDDELQLRLGRDENGGAVTLPLKALSNTHLRVQGSYPIEIIAQKANPVTGIDIIIDGGEAMRATRIEQ